MTDQCCICWETMYDLPIAIYFCKHVFLEQISDVCCHVSEFYWWNVIRKMWIFCDSEISKSIKHRIVLKIEMISMHFFPHNSRRFNCCWKKTTNFLQELKVITWSSLFWLKTYKEDEGIPHHVLEDCQQKILGKRWTSGVCVTVCTCPTSVCGEFCVLVFDHL